VILLFVDVVETWVGFEHEANLFVTLIGWTPFVLSHVALIIPMVLLGWKSMSEEEVIARAALFGIVVYFVIGTVMNALSLWIYGFF